MEILTEGQRAVIRLVARSPLHPEFFLTGGTALSAFYLHHRYSDDLDFFTESALAVPRVAPAMEKVAADLSALYDRSEPKDFVDVYALHREVVPFPQLVEKARRKHVGLDDYWLAQACARVREVRLLPRLIKPVTLDELCRFFEDQARRLMAAAE